MLILRFRFTTEFTGSEELGSVHVNTLVQHTTAERGHIVFQAMYLAVPVNLTGTASTTGTTRPWTSTDRISPCSQQYCLPFGRYSLYTTKELEFETISECLTSSHQYGGNSTSIKISPIISPCPTLLTARDSSVQLPAPLEHCLLALITGAR
ncbi:hypothetical protein RRG08_061586 [Elysia crispata]|uniref:Uncharacterized protein n=1 Tax=Elysia crispata TaxID=231223 RepID=A0AAE1D3Z1_9GAST|nr:hypothetical protein RRG08_061586 [Elysia crispata]